MADVNGGDEVFWIDTDATDIGKPDNPSTSRFLTDTFSDIATRLVSELGPPTRRLPGAEPKIRWDLPKVVVFLFNSSGGVGVRLVKPAYQAWADIPVPEFQE